MFLHNGVTWLSNLIELVWNPFTFFASESNRKLSILILSLNKLKTPNLVKWFTGKPLKWTARPKATKGLSSKVF